MSFSVSTKPHSATEIRSAIEHVEPGAHLSDRQLTVLRAGKAQALATLDAGDFADAGESSDLFFVVTISGHAGDDGADSLTVGITAQVPEPL